MLMLQQFLFHSHFWNLTLIMKASYNCVLRYRYLQMILLHYKLQLFYKRTSVAWICHFQLLLLM